MKWNLKPWQIGLICAAGVVVIGGAGTGIWYGVDRAIDNRIEDQVSSALETATAEPALDEPTTTATETESFSEKQTNKEPESVIVYVTPSTEEAITYEYNEVLSKEVSKLMGKKFPEAIYDESLLIKDNPTPQNFLHGTQITRRNTELLYIDTLQPLSSRAIVESWTNCVLEGRYFIQVYQYSNGWICAVIVSEN